MPELSDSTKQLLQKYQLWHNSLQQKEGIATIHVDEVASRVASFYEKIRGVVDYRDEHLLRKTAIERKLKRRMLLKKSGEAVAEPLINELIRGGHFPNDAIEEKKIEDVKKIVDKYVYILEKIPSAEESSKANTYNWIIGIAACEIEETLSPPLKERALIEYMIQNTKEKIRIKKEISEEEIEIQLYVAIQQALFNLDSPLITYHLLRRRIPDWGNLSPEKLKTIAKNICGVREKMESILNHPLAEKFYKICEKYDTPYLILDDIISESPSEAYEKLSGPERLENSIRKSYNQKVATLKSRLGRAAFYSTVSIFLTNVLSLFVLEIPFTKYVTGSFNFFAIGVDILGPTFLMFLLVATVKPPEKSNLNRVILETVKIVYKSEKKEIYEIRPSRRKGIISKILISALYLFSFCLSFGLIIWGLYNLNFPVLSYIIFVIFISLIAFTGMKIRGRARELKITESRDTFLGFLLDVLALPILRLGKWLSLRWKKYNAIAVIFSSLIDMPFQIFVEFLENWRGFLKEKKEEIH
jgi:hypothetical protein